MTIKSRDYVLRKIREAGWHDEELTAMRIYSNSSMGYPSYRAEFDKGRQLRLQGEPCTCRKCNEEDRDAGG